jgi:ATP-dependent RNA helicase DeaD
MENFRKLGIAPSILKVIEEEKFENPSEIQEKSIPLILAGKDVIASSATGSGKTLAFGVRLIMHSEKGKGVQSLVLTPTRELAEQETRALRKFSKNKPLEVAQVYGGVDIHSQIHHLRTADLVVGTPGRILDHLARGTLNLEHVKILVLDEADRMLDMGFRDDVEKIIRNCPEKRQTLLFSATLHSDVMRLAQKYMHNPVEVSAESYVDPSKLTHIYYDLESNQKFSLLVHFLKDESSKLVMVFCNTQRNTDFVANNLNSVGVEAIAIHGGYSQDKRSRHLQQFHDRKVHVLICTDVAARGLDIKDVSHIYNYDIPHDAKEYIHRVGRTARAGKEGKAISLLSQRDYENFQTILKDRSLEIKKEELPEFNRIMLKFADNRTRGHGFGGRDGGRPRHGGYGQRRFEGGDRERRFGGGDRDNRGYRGRGREGGERPERYFGNRPRRNFGPRRY